MDLSLGHKSLDVDFACSYVNSTVALMSVRWDTCAQASRKSRIWNHEEHVSLAPATLAPFHAGGLAPLAPRGQTSFVRVRLPSHQSRTPRDLTDLPIAPRCRNCPKLLPMLQDMAVLAESPIVLFALRADKEQLVQAFVASGRSVVRTVAQPWNHRATHPALCDAIG